MSGRDDQPATVPPPAGEDDAYNAATKVGAMPAEVMAKLREEGLLPEDPPEPPPRRPAPPRPAAPRPAPIDDSVPRLHSSVPPAREEGQRAPVPVIPRAPPTPGSFIPPSGIPSLASPPPPAPLASSAPPRAVSAPPAGSLPPPIASVPPIPPLPPASASFKPPPIRSFLPPAEHAPLVAPPPPAPRSRGQLVVLVIVVLALLMGITAFLMGRH